MKRLRTLNLLPPYTMNVPFAPSLRSCLATLACGLFAFLSFSAQAAVEEQTQRLTGSQITVNGSATYVEDNKYPLMVVNSGVNWQNLFTNRSVEANLEVGIIHEEGEDYEADYHHDFVFEVYKVDLYGQSTTENVTLELDYSHGSAADIDKSQYRVEGYYKVGWKLIAIYDHGTTTSVTKPDNIYIEGQVSTDRLHVFDHTTTPTISANHNTTDGTITFTWGYEPGAEEYELEWGFVNNYDGTGGSLTDAQVTLSEFDFEHNNTRVTTGVQFYRIANTFEEGFLVYRVRGRGWAGTTTQALVNGKWSTTGTGTNPKTHVDDWPNVLSLTAGHEQTFNWQYAATYAEGGKRKEVVSYADGSSRVRQQVTQINTDSVLIVGETYYDHQGRPAVTTLPVPGGGAKLAYHPDFHKVNVAGSSQTLSREHFDLDLSGNACAPSTLRLDSSTGSAQYYDSTAAVGNHQDYIPDGDGYTYVQTEYMPDQTGRIRTQSMPGEHHALGSGRESQYFYGQPMQEELDRLFGVNVGLASRYQKNLIVDANGQVAITYVDPAGRTIATSLAGEAPSGLDQVSGQSTQQMTVDLLNKADAAAVDTLTDDNHLESTERFAFPVNDALVNSRELLVTKDNKVYQYDYTAAAGVYTDTCVASGECHPYVYDLMISVADLCGSVNLYDGAVGSAAILDTFGSTSNTNCTGTTYSNLDISDTLDLGQHQVTKRIQVNAQAVEDFADYYMDTANNSCLLTYDQFLAEAQNLLSDVSCDITCDSCLSNIFETYTGHAASTASPAVNVSMTRNDWEGHFASTTGITSEQWLEEYYNCTSNCGSERPCEAAYGMMLLDVSPGGQWETELDDHWDASGIDYNDEYGIDATTTVSFSNGTYSPAVKGGVTPTHINGNTYSVNPEDLLYVADFKAAFQSSWAEALLEYHPEYCYYEACIKTEDAQGSYAISSFEYEQELRGYDTYAAASASGGLNISANTEAAIRDALVDNDPFFDFQTTTGYIYNVFDCGQSVPNDLTTMTNPPLFVTVYPEAADLDMISRYDNYASYNGTTMSMFDVAYYAIMCGGWYGTGCTTASDLSAMSTAQKDEFWSLIMNLYVAEKQKLVDAHREAIAMLDNCSNDYMDNLSGIDPRFRNAVDVAESLLPNVDLGSGNFFPEGVDAMESTLLSETGLCPTAFDLVTFLNALGTAGHLNSAAANVNASAILEFSPRLYSDITGIASTSFYNTAYVPLVIDPGYAGGSPGTLTINIAHGSYTCDIDLVIPSGCAFMTGEDFSTLGATNGWEIISVDQIGTITANGSDHDFELLMTIDVNPNGTAELHELVVTGTTCLDLDGCSYAVCNEVNQLARDLTDLLNVLSDENKLDVGTATAMDASPYAATFVPSVLQLKMMDEDVDYSSTASTTAQLLRATTVSGMVGYELEFSETLTSLDGDSLELVSVQADGNGNFTVLQMRAHPTSGGGGYTYFTVEVTGLDEQVTGYTTADPDFCCGIAEESVLYGVRTLMDEVVAGNVTHGTSYDYAVKLNPGLALALLDSGVTNNLNTSTFSLDLTGTAGTWKIDDSALAAKDLLVFTKNDSVYNVGNASSVIEILNVHRGSNHGTHEFTMLVKETGGTESVVDVSCLVPVPELDGEGCSTCIPEALTPLSCDKEWEVITDYFDNHTALAEPQTETYNGTTNVLGDFRDEFCERQLKYVAQTYIDYFTVMNITDSTDTDYITLDDFANLNGTGEMVAYVEYLEWLDGLSLLSSAVSAQGFANGNVAGCWPVYQLNANTSPLDDILTYCAGMEDYQERPCVAAPPLVAFPTVPYVDPCQAWVDSLAVMNATTAYNQYLQSVREHFMRSYIEGAINSLVETFDVTYDDEEFHQTLFYYDQSGSLVRTVPPQGVDTTFFNDVTTNGNDDVQTARAADNYDRTSSTQLPEHGFATTYRYNSLNQLVEQHTPDGGTSRLWYDKLGRVVLSQNAKQAVEGNYGGTERYSYTMYDDLGRPVEAGEVQALSNNASYASIDAMAKDATNFNRPGNDLFDWLTGATNSGLSKYDVVHSHYDKVVLTMPLQTTTQRGEVRNRITATTYSSELDITVSPLLDQINGNTVSYDYDRGTHYSYDVHGNVNTMVQEFTSLERLGHQYFRIDYTYDLLSGNVHQVAVRDVILNAQSGNSDAVPVPVPDVNHYGGGTTLSSNAVTATNSSAIEYSRAPFYYRYEYDADNRITAAYTSHDAKTWTRDAKYDYYAHGPLARVETGEHSVQGADYAYTIHGWLKGVNANRLESANDQGKDGETGIHEHVAPDAMGFSLNYYTGDYTSRTANGNDFLTDLDSLQSGTTYNQLYNGNISMMATALMDNNETALELSANHYKYDQLHRIKGMKSFLSGTGGNYTYANASNDATDTYATSYTFDGNGNLIDLTRKAATGSGGSSLMDDFSYLYYTDDYSTTYDPSASIPVNATNRLAYVTDASPNAGTWSTDIDGQSSGNYEYDEIGQLLRDNAEEISKIEWLVTNKVSKVIHNASTKDDLEFLYDAGGNRVVKIVKPKDGTTLSDEDQWTFTYYVRDASGNVLTTYTKTMEVVGQNDYRDKFLADEHHLYGSKRLGLSAANNPSGHLGITYAGFTYSGGGSAFTADGYLDLVDGTDLSVDTTLLPATTAVNAAIYAHQIGLKSYECSNHLGNVLAVVSDKPIEADGNADNLIDGLLADVVSFSDYYPYGAQLPGRFGNSADYRYGFQGQEVDNELKGDGNSVNYKYRMHDPRIGRFFAVDPLAPHYAHYTPYSFSGNRVVAFVELEGLEEQQAVKYKTQTKPAVAPKGSLGTKGIQRTSRHSVYIPKPAPAKHPIPSLGWSNYFLIGFQVGQLAWEFKEDYVRQKEYAEAVASAERRATFGTQEYLRRGGNIEALERIRTDGSEYTVPELREAMRRQERNEMTANDPLVVAEAQRRGVTSSTGLAGHRTYSNVPRSNGYWSGTPGNSLWFSDKEAVKNVTGGMGVPFKEGVVNFDNWAVLTIDVPGMVGDHTKDYQLLDARLVDEYSFENVTAAKRWRTENRLTPHHVPGGESMQLVPMDLHNNVNHNGGAMDIRNR